MEYKLDWNTGHAFLRIIPDGDVAKIEIYSYNKGAQGTLQVKSINWSALSLRDLALGCLKIARYINPSEADTKRLEDEAKADIEAMLNSITSDKSV